MTRNLYGKKMFITDLILVNIWALFFSRCHIAGLLLLIPARIALSFEMYRKSSWSLVSAIGFLLAYSCSNYVSRPFERMFYTFFCAIGKSRLMIDLFSNPLEWEIKVWIELITGLGFIWLAVVPVIVGIRSHNIKTIKWKNKWIWIYLIPLTVLCLWIIFDKGRIGGILLGLVITVLPVIYWSIYNRRERSPIQLLLNDKSVIWYFLYTTLLLSAVTIGLKDISSLKLVGTLVFPALFYIMLTISLRLGTVLTRCCIALSISGWLYWFSFNLGKIGTIILLNIAVGLIIFAVATMLFKTRTWKAPLILMVIVPIVIIPFTLGLNPYVVIDADYTRMYLSNLSVRNGVYIVEKYIEKHENGETYYSRRYGLRDRYGYILQINYNKLKTIDQWGRYIATVSPIQYGCMKSDQRYGIFDLRKRKFVVNPDNIEVSEVKKIDEMSFKLINSEGKHFATLYLPGKYRDIYYPDAHIEPQFAEEEIFSQRIPQTCSKPEFEDR